MICYYDILYLNYSRMSTVVQPHKNTYDVAQKKYYNSHKEQRKAKMREYYRLNAERIKARRKERYAEKKNAILLEQISQNMV